MQIKWNYPTLKYGINPPAVYRMDFDTGHFYIGSSKNVKTRIASWRTMFRTNKFSSVFFADSVKNVTKCTITFLEHPPLDKLLERETFYISLHFNTQLCINRSPTGFDNTGLRPLPRHLVPRKKRVNKQVYAFSKGVVQFDLNGKYIQSHKSIQDAADAVGVKRKFVYENMQVKRHRHGVKGFVFKVCGDNSPIERLTKKEKPINENIGKTRYRAIVNTETGDIFNIKEVANKFGLTVKHTYKVLGGYEGFVNTSKFKYGEGYVWR